MVSLFIYVNVAASMRWDQRRQDGGYDNENIALPFYTCVPHWLKDKRASILLPWVPSYLFAPSTQWALLSYLGYLWTGPVPDDCMDCMPAIIACLCWFSGPYPSSLLIVFFHSNLSNIVIFCIVLSACITWPDRPFLSADHHFKGVLCFDFNQKWLTDSFLLELLLTISKSLIWRWHLIYFFTLVNVQLSELYLDTGKTTVLIILIYVVIEINLSWIMLNMSLPTSLEKGFIFSLLLQHLL